MSGRRIRQQPVWPTLFPWGDGPGMLPWVWRTVDPGPNPRPLLASDVPPWFPTGAEGEPFRFCKAMERLIRAICLGSEEMSYINADTLIFSITQARSNDHYGLQARVTPLRFPGGTLEQTRQGIRYQVQRHQVNRVEKLYLVTFCLPRFLNQSFDEKMITIFHELYHIDNKCNGELRQHTGRCHAHTSSQQNYDAHMAALARFWLATKPDPSLTAFLRLDFWQLQARHGSVLGLFIPRPRLVPVTAHT